MGKLKLKTKDILVLITIFITSFLIMFSFNNTFIIIKGGSMEPTLYHNDVVVLHSKAPDRIEVGEIVVISSAHYFIENGGEPFFSELTNHTKIIHRVIEKRNLNGTWFYLTKGDNNDLIDGSIIALFKSQNYSIFEYNASNGIYIPETAIESVMLFKIPLLGYIQDFSHLILILNLLLILYPLLKQKFNYFKFRDKSLKILRKLNLFLFILLIAVSSSTISIYLIDNIYFMNNDSMIPSLYKDEMVISERVESRNIQINDIVIIESPRFYYEQGFDPIFWNHYSNDSYLIHRIVEKKEFNNSWFFVTQGDRSQWQPDGIFRTLNKTGNYDYFKFELNVSNKMYVPQEAILGVVVFKIPIIGAIFKNSGYILCLLIGGIIFISLRIRFMEKKKAKNHCK